MVSNHWDISISVGWHGSPFTLCEVTVQSRSNVFVLFVVLLKVHARALNSVVLAVQPLIMQNVSLPTI